MNILEIQKSKSTRDFILKNGNFELEVVADIIEVSKDIPFVGSLFKLGKVAINYMDWRFINKLSFFLEASSDINEEKIQLFIKELTPKENKHISSYLIHLLYSSEEDEKASIMGMIYKTRLLNEIDNDTMLRLCSIISKSFLIDLKKLPLYINQSNEDSLEASNFINLGLIDNFVGGYWVNTPTWILNDIGKTLYRILKSNKWFDN